MLSHEDLQIKYASHEVEAAERQLFGELDASYGDKKDRTAMCLLSGAFYFFAGFARATTLDWKTSFCSASSMNGMKSEGVVRVNLTPNAAHVTGHHVVMFEDCIDTCITMQKMAKLVLDMVPASLHIVFMINKSGLSIEELETMLGVKITCLFDSDPSDYLVGRGLDSGQHHRFDRDIAIYKPRGSKRPYADEQTGPTQAEKHAQGESPTSAEDA